MCDKRFETQVAIADHMRKKHKNVSVPTDTILCAKKNFEIDPLTAASDQRKDDAANESVAISEAMIAKEFEVTPTKDTGRAAARVSGDSRREILKTPEHKETESEKKRRRRALQNVRRSAEKKNASENWKKAYKLQRRMQRVDEERIFEKEKKKRTSSGAAFDSTMAEEGRMQVRKTYENAHAMKVAVNQALANVTLSIKDNFVDVANKRLGKKEWEDEDKEQLLRLSYGNLRYHVRSHELVFREEREESGHARNRMYPVSKYTADIGEIRQKAEKARNEQLAILMGLDQGASDAKATEEEKEAEGEGKEKKKTVWARMCGSDCEVCEWHWATRVHSAMMDLIARKQVIYFCITCSLWCLY